MLIAKIVVVQKIKNDIDNWDDNEQELKIIKTIIQVYSNMYIFLFNL